MAAAVISGAERRTVRDMAIRIRPPRKDDAEALAEIHLENCRFYSELDPDAFQVPREEGLVEWFASFLEEASGEDELTLVAEVEGEVVGMLEGRIERPAESADRQLARELAEKRLFVSFVGVLRQQWRSGVGSELMGAAEEWGRRRGATVAALDTYIGSPVSVPFYEQRLGYRRHSINLRKRL